MRGLAELAPPGSKSQIPNPESQISNLTPHISLVKKLLRSKLIVAWADFDTVPFL